MSVSNNWRMVFLEYSFTGSSVAFDTSNHINHNSASTSQVGPAITLTGTNDAIVQFLSMSGSSVVTSINQSYVIENTSSGSGQAHSAADLINTTSNTAPTWTTGSSNSECSAIAFKETGGGAPPGCKNGVTLLGVGC
jgi:hypothetical protein